jgi:hypothetical protein
LTPPSIADALSKVVVLEQVGSLQAFVIDGVIGLNQAQRRLVVKIRSLATYRLMRLR